jgi:hypothetical protein
MPAAGTWSSCSVSGLPSEPASSRIAQDRSSEAQVDATVVSGGQASSGWLSRMNRSSVDPERLLVRTKTGDSQAVSRGKLLCMAGIVPRKAAAIKAAESRR